MKRVFFRLVAALLTFSLGLSLAVMVGRHNQIIGAEQADKRMESERMIRISNTLTSRSLSAKLQDIDREYKERCQTPDYIGDDNPSIIRLREFKTCNDKWTKARLDAIEAELRHHLVRL